MCSCGSAVWETLETGEIVSRQSSNQHVTSLGPRTAAGVGSVTCCWPWHLPSSLQERKRAEGQRAQRARSHRGWGHLETLHCAGGGAHNTHTAAGQGPGSWQPAWGGKHRQKHQNRHNPRGPGWGRGAYAGGRPWLPWQEGSREVQHCSA